MLHPVPVDSGPLPADVEAILEDIARGKVRNSVHVYVRRAATGEVEDLGVSPNLRTTAGLNWQSDVMGADSQPVAAQWIGLTLNATAPAAGDTTLTAEIAAGGLTRAEGTYAHTGGATFYTITRTFTASAVHTGVSKAGLFTAVSAGTMAFETLLNNPATLQIGDTLTITWTVNI